MNTFLTSNEWQYRLLRTIIQGILGVVVANKPRPDCGRVRFRSKPTRSGGGSGNGGS